MKYIEYSSEKGWDVRPYSRWLDKHKLLLPEGARSFAEAQWHYDIKNHLCPHDSWLERFELLEIGYGERAAIRKNTAKMVLLGAFHDVRFTIEYKELRALKLEHSSNDGFGDWLIDEIALDDQNEFVIHEIHFSNKAAVTIECADINFVFENIS